MATIIGKELRKFVAPEFIFGIGARAKAVTYALNLAISKALIVTDEGVIEAGWIDELTKQLEDNDIEPILFKNVSPNPRDFEVKEGAAIYREKKCDGIISLGGGSPMDCAKGIAILVSNEGKILDYEGVDMIPEPLPPLICIPSTSGTAADVSQFAIITNTNEKYKAAIISKAIVPDIALIDPEITTTMDSYLTACTGLDALTHAVEAYVSNANSLLTDIHAIKAIELVKEWLPLAIQNPLDPIAREQMSMASLEAGLAFSNASLGAVHAMAHSLGGYLDLPHGECNALLLNHVMAYNHPNVPQKINEIAQIFGADVEGLGEAATKLKVIESIFNFRASVGVERTLGQIGVHRTDLHELSIHAHEDPCLLTNPRDASAKDIEVIYAEAL